MARAVVAAATTAWGRMCVITNMGRVLGIVIWGIEETSVKMVSVLLICTHLTLLNLYISTALSQGHITIIICP